MQRVLVTGASGFVGLEVAKALARRGTEVIAFDMVVGAGLAALAASSRNVRAVPGEITEWQAVAGLLKDHAPDAVVHCAALVGVPASIAAPFRTFEVNVGGSLNLLEAMRLFGVRRMIHLSSEETYGQFEAPAATEDHPQRPLMPYGISKLAVEQLGRSYRALHGLECINIRTCWVYGPLLPRPRIPKNLLDAALAGRPLHLPEGGDFSVDHTHVSDCVQGILLALDKRDHPFDAYNIGSGRATSVREMVEIIKGLVPGADLSAGPGNYTYGGVVAMVKKGALDISRARRVLEYEPRFDFRAGMADYLREARLRPG